MGRSSARLRNGTIGRECVNRGKIICSGAWLFENRRYKGFPGSQGGVSIKGTKGKWWVSGSCWLDSAPCTPQAAGLSPPRKGELEQFKPRESLARHKHKVPSTHSCHSTPGTSFMETTILLISPVPRHWMFLAAPRGVNVVRKYSMITRNAPTKILVSFFNKVS